MTSRQIAPEEILVGDLDGAYVQVIIYGDERSPAAQFVADAAGWPEPIRHPRQASLATHRMVAVVASWLEHQPMGKVRDTLKAAQAAFKGSGWAIAQPVDGVPMTGTTVDDLGERWKFPELQLVYGCNAARGFSFEAEMPSEETGFSSDELEALRQLAMAVYRLL